MNIFFETFHVIDSRVLALQEEKDLSISYTRNHNFQLFAESKDNEPTVSVGLVRFKNGSLIDITLTPGSLVQGIAQRPPILQFFRIIDNHRTMCFSFKEKEAPHGTMTIWGGNPPLVPGLSVPEQKFTDVTFDPQQEVFGETQKKEFLKVFTQLIGYVMSQDTGVKRKPR